MTFRGEGDARELNGPGVQRGTQSSGDQILVLRREKEFKGMTNSKQERASFIKAKVYTQEQSVGSSERICPELSELQTFVLLAVASGTDNYDSHIMISQGEPNRGGVGQPEVICVFLALACFSPLESKEREG